MDMRKIQYILGGMALLLLPVSAYARQLNDSTLNRTVVVEQDYNPDILDATKINVLPKVEPPTAHKRAVEYDAALAPARTLPATVMQAYAGKEAQPKALPGYARLGYGNYGNLDLFASYLYAPSAQNRFGVNLQMDGRNGELNLPGSGEKWNARYYRTQAHADYRHAFKRVALNLAGNFGLSNFNFLPASSARKQKFTSGDFRFGVYSTGDDFPVRFSVESGLLFYERQKDLAYSDVTETMAHTMATAGADITDGQSIFLELLMDNVFYKNNAYENYTALTLTPYYLFQNDDWNIRLGAHVDVAFGFGKKFYASPDFSVEYTFADSYRLYAQATGGKRRNDFRRMELVAPYGQAPVQLESAYEQLNAALGFKASPAAGLWFNLYGGYQNVKNDLLQMRSSAGDITEDYPHALLLETAGTQNLYAGAELSYGYKNLFSFSLAGTYRNWSIDNEESYKQGLLFKPSVEAKLQAECRPVSAAFVQLGYRHAVREKVDGVRMETVGNLYLNGSYEFWKGISVYARLDNILNKDYQYYWGYPDEGFNFVGGVSFKF